MNCCICGTELQHDDYIIRLQAFKYVEEGGAAFRLRRTRFQDGTADRFAHINCPVIEGAPMSLIGADEIPMEEGPDEDEYNE